MNELNQTYAVPPPIEETREYRPSTQQALTEHRIEIKFLSRGCVVSVGCKEIAFETVDAAMTELNAYVAEPYEMQKKWREILK